MKLREYYNYVIAIIFTILQGEVIIAKYSWYWLYLLLTVSTSEYYFIAKWDQLIGQCK